MTHHTEDMLRDMLAGKAVDASVHAEPDARVMRRVRNRRVRNAAAIVASVALATTGVFAGLRLTRHNAVDEVTTSNWKTVQSNGWQMLYPPAWTADVTASSDGFNIVIGNTASSINNSPDKGNIFVQFGTLALDQPTATPPADTSLPIDPYAVKLVLPGASGPLSNDWSGLSAGLATPFRLRVWHANQPFQIAVLAGMTPSSHDLRVAGEIIRSLAYIGAATPSMIPSPTPSNTSGTNGTTINQIQDVTAIDAQHAWALVSLTCSNPNTTLCPARLLTTADGGATWTEVAIPASMAGSEGLSASTDTPIVSRALFVTLNDGWIFGANAYVTHDGGKTWTEQSPGRLVRTVTGSVQQLWELGCTQQPLPGCQITVRTSTDLGRTWHEATSPGMDRDPGQLVVIGPHSAAVMSGMSPAQGGNFLAVTTDDGTTWSKPAKPQDCQDNFGTAMAGRNGVLYLLCGSQPGAGSQMKSLWRYSSGGFVKVATSPATDQAGKLPTTGYVNDIIETPDGTLWAGLDRHGLISSHDGTTWTQDTTFVGETFFTTLDFIDDQTGWVAASGASGPGAAAGDGSNPSVYLTTDGGAHWTVVKIPSSVSP